MKDTLFRYGISAITMFGFATTQVNSTSKQLAPVQGEEQYNFMPSSKKVNCAQGFVSYQGATFSMPVLSAAPELAKLLGVRIDPEDGYGVELIRGKNHCVKKGSIKIVSDQYYDKGNWVEFKEQNKGTLYAFQFKNKKNAHKK